MLKNDKKKRDIILSLILAAVVLALLIYVDKEMHYSMLASIIQKAAIYSLLAVSLNLLNGFTGLFSLGQAGFMMVGAYTYAILTIPLDQHASVYQYFNGGIVNVCLPAWVGLIAAGLVAAGFAWLVGKPCLKLKSDYLAIATLGFAEILRAIIQWDVLGPVTNASNILKKFPKFDSVLTPVLLAAFCIALIVLLINSSYGRAFKAIREDEIAAEAMGINLAKTKMQAFLTSAFFAGIGGAMLAMFQASVYAKAFTSAMTYEILLIVVIGGIGCIGVHYSPVHEDVRQAVAPLPAWNGKHHLSFVYGGRAAGGHDCGLPPDGQSADIPCGVCCCYACRIFLCTADLSLL